MQRLAFHVENVGFLPRCRFPLSKWVRVYRPVVVTAQSFMFWFIWGYKVMIVGLKAKSRHLFISLVNFTSLAGNFLEVKWQCQCR